MADQVARHDFCRLQPESGKATVTFVCPRPVSDRSAYIQLRLCREEMVWDFFF
jgi:hypothetical protein